MELLLPTHYEEVGRPGVVEVATMDPSHMQMMAGRLPKGRYLFCPDGSHMAMYDDQKTYVDGLIAFVRDVDAGRF